MEQPQALFMADIYHALGLHMHQPQGNLVALHKYVLVDSIYIKPKREMRWEELRYRPILDRFRAGTLGFTPIHISQYPEKYPPKEEVEVHPGAWNTEHHWGGDFTQWTGSLLQKKGFDKVRRASEYHWQVKRGFDQRQAALAKPEEVRQLIICCRPRPVAIAIGAAGGCIARLTDWSRLTTCWTRP
jgi:hypothetical protein